MKGFRCIMFLAAAVFLLTAPALAAEYSLAVMHRWEDVPLEGVSFFLYPAEGSQTDAQSAYEQVLLQGLAPAAQSVTDANGMASFPGLSQGRYLLVGRSHMLDGDVYEAEPCLLTLPVQDADGAPLAELLVETKIARRDGTLPGQWRVMLLWEDGEGSSRPPAVEVQLYRNAELFDTIRLDAAVNWQYTWTDSDPAGDWAVLESVPAGYRAEYERQGDTFVVRNIRLPEEPETTPDANPDPGEQSGPQLPQTGQLWWPVPVMALGGMILFLLGCLRRKERRDES